MPSSQINYFLAETLSTVANTILQIMILCEIVKSEFVKCDALNLSPR